MLDIQHSDVTPRYAFAVGDKVTFLDATWTVFERLENGFAFRPESENRPVQEFTNTQLAHFARSGELSHIPYRRPASEENVSEFELASFLASRNEAHHETARGREALVLAFDALHEAGKVKSTHASVQENISTIHYEATRINTLNRSDNANVPTTFASKTIFRWRKKYHKYGLISLYDSSPGKGNRHARLHKDVLEIITPLIQRYAEPNPPTKIQILEDVQIAIRDANRWRVVSGLSKLTAPSKTTINAKIKELDPFLVCLAHHGETVAKRRFCATRLGPQAERPLQRVEIDEWRTDLITLLSQANLLGWLEEAEKQKLGLKKDRLRVLVTVAICVATKCIVGMVISPEGSSDSARQTIEMILNDKGQLAKNSGARMAWCMAGKPGLIVTDCAKYNISDATRRTVAAIGTRLEHCPAGEPQMKAVIERVFRTMSTRLLPRLTGRTYSDVVSKGDHKPEDNAALTVDDFCQILVRWIVDIYHVTPHRGLGGETPFDCWQRLVGVWGVNPAPHRETHVLAFGTREDRMVQKNGIARMGIQYHCEELAEWFLHNEDRKVPIIWHRSDLGCILVEIEGKWQPVPSVHGMFRGVSASEWEQIVHAQRANNRANAAVYEDIVLDAIKDIKAMNSRAIASAGKVVEKWTEKRTDALENECKMAFSNCISEIPPGRHGEAMAEPGFGIELPTAGNAGMRGSSASEIGGEFPEVSETSMEPAPAEPTRKKISESLSDQNSAIARSGQRRTGHRSGGGTGAETTHSFGKK